MHVGVYATAETCGRCHVHLHAAVETPYPLYAVPDVISAALEHQSPPQSTCSQSQVSPL
jgi:hypothetical protein